MSDKKKITTCQDALATGVRATYVDGGNGENLYSTLNDLAIHLDENTITDKQEKGVGSKHQIYDAGTISAFKSLCFRMRRNSAFKSLCFRMRRNEINNNQK